MYGEWLYAKHTSFYDALPHYFLEFDLFDKEKERFLSTAARRKVLDGLPVMPVPVLNEGELRSSRDVEVLVTKSLYKTANWRDVLKEAAATSGNRPEMVEQQTEDTDLSEGLYIKQEDAESVVDRFKYVRAGFIQTLTDSDSHWHSRPILPNQLGGRGRYLCTGSGRERGLR